MFIPKRVIFEKGSLDTEIGQNIFNKVKDIPNVEIINASSNRIKSNTLETTYMNNTDPEKRH